MFKSRGIPGVRAALIAASFLAAPAYAQDSPLPETGTWNVSFAFPEGGGTSFGVGTMVTSRWTIGLEIDFQTSDTDLEPTEGSAAAESEVDDKQFLIGPVVKHYLRETGDVIPFLRASFALGWTNNQTLQTNAVREFDTFTASGRVGIGADWFATEAISFGANTGLLLNYATATNTLNDVGLEQTTWALTTFRSNVSVSFWF